MALWTHLISHYKSTKKDEYTYSIEEVNNEDYEKQVFRRGQSITLILPVKNKSYRIISLPFYLSEDWKQGVVQIGTRSNWTVMANMHLKINK